VQQLIPKARHQAYRDLAIASSHRFPILLQGDEMTDAQIASGQASP
jgi:hypothetical protein